MFGMSTLRETWNTQWGPEPVLALHGTRNRAAPITLPGGFSRSPGVKRTGAGLARAV